MIKSIDTSRGIVVIREASMADVAQFRDLRLYALQDSPISFSADYQTNLNHPLEYWQNRLRDTANEVTFLAEHEHRLIGMSGIARGYSPKTKHSATVYSVFVHPEWRGLRIAEALLEACIEWARSKEVNIIKLSVNAANASAIRCYQRCGFTIYGTEPNALLHEGQYYDEYFMSKMLDSS